MEPQWTHVKAVVAAAFVVMAIAFCFSLAGCPRPMPPPVPPVDADAGSATCETACARLQRLGCPAGQPTPKGVPCVAVCLDVTSSGLITWDLDCISRGVTCGATDRCAR